MCFNLQDLHGENQEHKLRPSTAADIQHSLKGVQGGEQKRGSVCWRWGVETGRAGLPVVRYFQGLIL